MEENQQQPEETGLFDDHISYTEASQGQRFVNWLVDNILIRIIITQFTVHILIRIMLDLVPEFTYKAFGEGTTFAGLMVSYLFSILHYLFYYSICEKAFKGYTLGKLISGTRAIRADGAELTFKYTILRH